MKQLRNTLIARAHQLCHQLGLSEDDRRAMLYANFGTDSMKNMKYYQLSLLCEQLQQRLSERTTDQDRKSNAALDKARKKLIASIGGYLRATGQEENMELIKGVACRAAMVQHFNKIDIAELKRLSVIFMKKSNDRIKQNVLTQININ